MVQYPRGRFPVPSKPISEYTSDDELATMMKNAKKQKEMDYWWQCFRQRCKLKRADRRLGKTELERAFNETMHAYEMLKSDVAGHKVRANRIWSKVDKDQSVKPILEKWALSKTEEDGFKFLVKNEYYDLTGEYLVLQFPDDFSSDVLAGARRKLLDAGVSEEKLPSR